MRTILILFLSVVLLSCTDQTKSNKRFTDIANSSYINTTLIAKFRHTEAESSASRCDDGVVVILRNDMPVNELNPVPFVGLCDLSADVVVKIQGNPSGSIISITKNGGTLHEYSLNNSDEVYGYSRICK
jgi:hypothetical protein